jgi:hypothetical protein
MSSIEKTYQWLLSEHTKHRSEVIILVIAIVSFLLHLALIYLLEFGIVKLSHVPALLRSPIAAIYTPFSFILVYEVYLLVYYLPKSITVYIGKQYEIITLIIIRRLFKDLAGLKLSTDWFAVKEDLQFTYDLLTALVLFYAIYLFHANIASKPADIQKVIPTPVARFIWFKQLVAVCLVPVLVAMAVYAFVNWAMGVWVSSQDLDTSFKNLNSIFFEEFFTLLIIVDVLLLLFSFFYTNTFHKVIRNSGFIISTILLRISFSVEGLINNLLIVSAILFGLLMVVIHNQYERLHQKNTALMDVS